jgi:hypothetical protein
LEGHIWANRWITSLFFFAQLHYWCWMTTHSTKLTSSTINKRLVCKGTLSLCFPESPLDVRAISKSQCYQLARHESYAWWSVLIWLPLIYCYSMSLSYFMLQISEKKGLQILKKVMQPKGLTLEETLVETQNTLLWSCTESAENWSFPETALSS